MIFPSDICHDNVAGGLISPVNITGHITAEREWHHQRTLDHAAAHFESHFGAPRTPQQLLSPPTPAGVSGNQPSVSSDDAGGSIPTPPPPPGSKNTPPSQTRTRRKPANQVTGESSPPQGTTPAAANTAEPKQ